MFYKEEGRIIVGAVGAWGDVICSKQNTSDGNADLLVSTFHCPVLCKMRVLMKSDKNERFCNR